MTPKNQSNKKPRTLGGLEQAIAATNQGCRRKDWSWEEGGTYLKIDFKDEQQTVMSGRGLGFEPAGTWFMHHHSHPDTEGPKRVSSDFSVSLLILRSISSGYHSTCFAHCIFNTYCIFQLEF